MRHNLSARRPALPRLARAGVLAGTLVAVTGCGWFGSGSELYAADPANRPLEVPPELVVAGDSQADGAATGSVTASGTVAAARQARAAAAAGFTVAGERDQVFAAVDEALSSMEGVTVTSRARLLGALDIQYGNENLLVRVVEGADGVTVSAVDPRGAAAAGPGIDRLMQALEAAVAQR